MFFGRPAKVTEDLYGPGAVVHSVSSIAEWDSNDLNRVGGYLENVTYHAVRFPTSEQLWSQLPATPNMRSMFNTIRSVIECLHVEEEGYEDKFSKA